VRHFVLNCKPERIAAVGVASADISAAREQCVCARDSALRQGPKAVEAGQPKKLACAGTPSVPSKGLS
jgi:hypothetical protein